MSSFPTNMIRAHHFNEKGNALFCVQQVVLIGEKWTKTLDVIVNRCIAGPKLGADNSRRSGS